MKVILFSLILFVCGLLLPHLSIQAEENSVGKNTLGNFSLKSTLRHPNKSGRFKFQMPEYGTTHGKWKAPPQNVWTKQTWWWKGSEAKPR